VTLCNGKSDGLFVALCAAIPSFEDFGGAIFADDIWVMDTVFFIISGELAEISPLFSDFSGNVADSLISVVLSRSAAKE